MPIRDEAAQNKSLDNDYGTTRGPNTPNSLQVALLGTSNPSSEITGLGYARATLSSNDWLPAANRVKASNPVSFGPPTGPWTTAEYLGLYDPVGAVWWDVVSLTESLSVTGAGDPVIVVVNVAAGNTFEA